MAKVTWSAFIGDARGKVGSIAATMTRSGPMVRVCRTQIRRSTPAQLTQRMALATASQLWKSELMVDYRAGWILLATAHPEEDVFGTLITKTGLAWFTRCTKNRNTFGLEPLLEAPTYDVVGTPGGISSLYDPEEPESWTVTPTTPPAANEAVIIQATPGLSPGRLTISKTQRTILALEAGTSGPWDILEAYRTKFGDPPVDLQVFILVWYVDINQGRPGLLATTQLIIYGA